MKARVIATGQIIEINESSTIYDAGMCHIYNASELENVPDADPDYWTRLEHTYAGMAMQGLLTNSNLTKLLRDEKVSVRDKTHLLSEWAKMYAHTLVEKYKKEERK